MRRPVALATATVAIVVILAGASLAAPGSPLWTKRYNGPGNDSDVGNALAVSPNGATVYVTGQSGGSSTSQDYATFAYNSSTGAVQWTQRYDGPAHGHDSAISLAVSPDGSAVFVTGSSDSANLSDFFTVAYNATTGAPLWTRRYNGSANSYDSAYSVDVSPSGDEVFVTGYSEGASSGGDFATIAYDASNGASLWTKRYNGPGNSFDSADSLAVSPNGDEVFVTGSSTSSSNEVDYATIAYDVSSGLKIWTRRYVGFGNGDNQATAIAVSPDATKVFVTGGSRTDQFGDGQQDYATIAYNASNGASLWTERYTGLGSGRDFGTSIEVAPDGVRVFVTGQSVFDYATIAYDASNGNDLWTRRYSGPGSGEDQPYAVAVSPNGMDVYVTGGSAGYNTGQFDYATLAYDAATGADLWTRRYNGSGNAIDVATSVAVSPSGASLFVTGASDGPGTQFDVVTIGYDAQ